MYAVIKTGGKQYKVQQGDTLRVEKLDAEAGESIRLSDVLMVIDEGKVSVGNPVLQTAHVSAKVVSHGRGEKLKIIKFRRRKHHRKQMGHRQAYTELSIESISA